MVTNILRDLKHTLLFVGILLFSFIGITSVKAHSPPPPVVHVVLFWMEGCPHCHEVLDNILPPLQENYGDQLQISLIELSSMEDIERLYAVTARFGISKERVGVPLLLIGEQVLIGSDLILAELPGLIETYLAEGGVALPDVPEFTKFLPQAPTPEETCTITTPCIDNGFPADAMVNGILFTTPDCHDCQLIAGQVLKMAREDYQGRFTLETIDVVTSEDVDYLYQVTAQFDLTAEETELPLLILGDHILVNENIPAQLPGLIETYLQAGGLSRVTLPTPEGKITNALIVDTLSRPDGFWIAISTLVFLASALLYSLIQLRLAAGGDRRPEAIPSWQSFPIPILALIGLGVAGYLAYVETNLVSAICGPVGDCNAVQSSPYARLFGIMPIGILGMVGYLSILLIWGWSRFRNDRLAKYSPLALYGMSFVGTLFSLYLTYLEPFVIQAVCMWCISSAIIMALLLLFSSISVTRPLFLIEEIADEA